MAILQLHFYLFELHFEDVNLFSATHQHIQRFVDNYLGCKMK